MRLDMEAAILIACGFTPEELLEIEAPPTRRCSVWRQIIPEKAARKWP